MNTATLKTQAKDNLHGKFGVTLLGTVITNALCAAADIIPIAGSFLVSGPLDVGLAGMYYKDSQDEKPELSNLFDGFRNNFGETFLLGILRWLFTFLWSLLLIVPGIVKEYAYAMSSYLMVREPELSAMEALQKSQECMKGHKGELFLLDLSFIGWYALCVITFGLACIYVLPYHKETRMCFYNKIYDNAEA